MEEGREERREVCLVWCDRGWGCSLVTKNSREEDGITSENKT